MKQILEDNKHLILALVIGFLSKKIMLMIGAPNFISYVLGVLMAVSWYFFSWEWLKPK